MRSASLLIAILALGACKKVDADYPNQRRVAAKHEAGHVILVRAYPQVFKLRSATVDETGDHTTYDYIGEADTDEAARLRLQVMVAGRVSEEIFGEPPSPYTTTDDVKARRLAMKIAAEHPEEIDTILDAARFIAHSMLVADVAELTHVANELLHYGSLDLRQ